MDEQVERERVRRGLGAQALLIAAAVRGELERRHGRALTGEEARTVADCAYTALHSFLHYQDSAAAQRFLVDHAPPGSGAWPDPQLLEAYRE